MNARPFILWYYILLIKLTGELKIIFIRQYLIQHLHVLASYLWCTWKTTKTVPWGRVESVDCRGQSSQSSTRQMWNTEWTTNKSPFFTRGKRSEADSDQPSLINQVNQQCQDHHGGFWNFSKVLFMNYKLHNLIKKVNLYIDDNNNNKNK